HPGHDPVLVVDERDWSPRDVRKIEAREARHAVVALTAAPARDLRAVLEPIAARMREHDAAVVRRDPVEVAVHDPDHRVARQLLLLRQLALGRRTRREPVGAPDVRRLRARQTRSALARDVPLGLDDLVVVDLETRGRDREVAAPRDDAVVRGLAALLAVVPALHLAKPRHALPHARAAR